MEILAAEQIKRGKTSRKLKHDRKYKDVHLSDKIQDELKDSKDHSCIIQELPDWYQQNKTPILTMWN